MCEASDGTTMMLANLAAQAQTPSTTAGGGACANTNGNLMANTHTDDTR